MGKKHFCFFQTAETGNRTPNSGVKGSGANHYPRAPAQLMYTECLLLGHRQTRWINIEATLVSRPVIAVDAGIEESCVR